MDIGYLSRNAESAARLSHLQRRRGYTIQGSKIWDDDEDKIIRSTADLTIERVQRRLPHRTSKAIERRRAVLGLQRRNLKQWTTGEDRILRQNIDGLDYVAISKLLPGRSVHAVQGRAWYLGVRKGCLHKPKPKGLPIYDAVRLRGFEDGITMCALDRELQTGKYFQSNYRRTLNWKKLARAIEFFGGKLTVDWNDQ